MTTNTNIYKIKKRVLEKKLISLIETRDPKYKYKLSIHILRPPDTYDDVKKQEKKSSESKTNTKTKSY